MTDWIVVPADGGFRRAAGIILREGSEKAVRARLREFYGIKRLQRHDSYDKHDYTVLAVFSDEAWRPEFHILRSDKAESHGYDPKQPQAYNAKHSIIRIMKEAKQ